MKHSRITAMLTIAFCALLWSTGGLLIKWVDMPPLAIAGSRSGIAGLVMLVYLTTSKRERLGKPNKYQMTGMIVYSVMIISYVAANKLTTAANAILLQFTAPVWVALLAGIFLKEKVTKLDWISVFITMGGIYLFFQDSLGSYSIFGSVLAIISGICLAGVIILLKLDYSPSPVQFTFMGNALTFLICLPSILQSQIDMFGLTCLILLGVFQLGISYILYNNAVKHVTAIEAILITLIEPMLNPVWVILFTGESPGPKVLTGGIIVLSTIIINGIMKQRDNSIQKQAKPTTI